VEVLSLAKAQRSMSDTGFAAATTAINGGAGFSLNLAVNGGAPTTIRISAANATAGSVVGAINAAGLGVKAQLLTKTIFEVDDQRKELRAMNHALRSTMDALQRRQEELAAEVARRKAILHNSSAGILVVDGDGIITEANRRLLEMTGYAERDLLGRHASLLHHDREAFARFRRRIHEDEPGGDHFNEYPLRRKDGSQLWCDLSGRPIDPLDPAQGMACVCVDVSDRRRAEMERQEREQRLATLIEALPDAIWFKDPAGRWLVANRPALELFCLHDAPWQGRT
jgi:PAS domain S-box-containing protein